MFKLVFKFFNYSELTAFCLISVLSTTSAAPSNPLPLPTQAVASQVAWAIMPSKASISIADLAQIQQQILHQEFVKKLALVEAQNSLQKSFPEIKKNSLAISYKEPKLTDKKIAIKSKPQHQLRVLAIYGPLAQQTAEVSLNGQSHIISYPTQLGWFKLLGIHHNKIVVQTFNPTQKSFDQAASTSNVHAHPVYELLTGQQLEVQP
jgi:hypothetical protein